MKKMIAFVRRMLASIGRFFASLFRRKPASAPAIAAAVVFPPMPAEAKKEAAEGGNAPAAETEINPDPAAPAAAVDQAAANEGKRVTEAAAEADVETIEPGTQQAQPAAADAPATPTTAPSPSIQTEPVADHPVAPARREPSWATLAVAAIAAIAAVVVAFFLLTPAPTYEVVAPKPQVAVIETTKVDTAQENACVRELQASHLRTYSDEEAAELCRR